MGAASQPLPPAWLAATVQVPVAELSVDRGVISHVVSGRTVRYGQVAGAAVRLTPPDPKSITLRKPADWTIAGRPLNRLDTAPKLDGSKIFGVDLVRQQARHDEADAGPFEVDGSQSRRQPLSCDADRHGDQDCQGKPAIAE